MSVLPWFEPTRSIYLLLPGIKNLTNHYGVEVVTIDQGDALLFYFEGATREFKSTIFEVWADHNDFHLITAVLVTICEALKED